MGNSRNNGQKSVVVLGMHRSGTSAVSRVLNLLGVDLGPDLMHPTPDNPKGYWEHKGIVDTHDRLLTKLGSSWDDIRPRPESWMASSAAVEAKAEILEIIRKDFTAAALWGLKDPRMCRLLDLWRSVFIASNTQPGFVIFFRNPLEVAASLNKRDNMGQSKALMLWLLHVTDSEEGTRGFPRVFVSFQGLLADWRNAAERMREGLHLDWPRRYDSAAPAVTDFLDHELKHHNCGADAMGAATKIPDYIVGLYQALRAAERTGHDSVAPMVTEAVDSLRQEMDTLPARSFLEEMASLASKTATLAERDMLIASLNEQLDRILASKSWKLTAPLRKGLERLQNLLQSGADRNLGS